MFTSGGAPWGAHSYSGPYRALKQEEKILLVQLGDRQEWISADRLKKHTGGVPVPWSQAAKMLKAAWVKWHVQ